MGLLTGDCFALIVYCWLLFCGLYVLDDLFASFGCECGLFGVALREVVWLTLLCVWVLLLF